MIYKNVSCKTVILKVMNTFRIEDENQILSMVEWIGEGLKFIGAFAGYDNMTKTLSVEHHRVPLPYNLHELTQICYNGVPMTWNTKTFKYRDYVCQDCIQQTSSNDTIVVMGNILTDVGVDYSSNAGIESVNINQVVKAIDGYYSAGTSNHYYKRINSDMADTNLANVDYTMASDWEDVTNRFGEYSDTPITSDIANSQGFTINAGYIRTEFEEGDITVSFNAIPVDEDGFPMVPDDISFATALQWYLISQLLLGGYKLKAEGINFEYADHKWQQYCTQAKTKSIYPDLNQLQSFTNSWVRLIQRNDRFASFFENLGESEGIID